MATVAVVLCSGLIHPLMHSDLKAKNSEWTVIPQGNLLLEELPSVPPDTLAPILTLAVRTVSSASKQCPGQGLCPILVITVCPNVYVPGTQKGPNKC